MNCCNNLFFIFYCIITFATFIPIIILVSMSEYEIWSDFSTMNSLYKSCSEDTKICETPIDCYSLNSHGLLLCKNTKTCFNILIAVAFFNLFVFVSCIAYRIYSQSNKNQDMKFLKFTLITNGILFCMNIGFFFSLLTNYLMEYILSAYLIYAIIIYGCYFALSFKVLLLMFCYFIIYQKCLKKKSNDETIADEELLPNV